MKRVTETPRSRNSGSSEVYEHVMETLRRKSENQILGRRDPP